jgi:hypothetical protein
MTRKSIRITSLALSGALLSSIWLAPLSNSATPKVTATQKAQLIYIIQEEKLARDVYAALAAKGFSQKFGNITPSEQSHMDLLAGILKTYGIANPTTGLKAGVFKDKNLTALYAKIMKTAPNSSADAIAAGVLIERTDIADIEKMIKGFTQADIKTVLNSLLSGSQKHLAAFTR